MSRRLPQALVLAVLVFLFAPVAVVVLFSFNDVPSTGLPFRGFSLRWYRAAFEDPLFRDSLRNSVVVAGATAAFVVLVGVNAAFAIARRPSRLARAFAGLVTTPLILPGLFLGVALLSFFDAVGLRLSLFTVFLGHALVTLPFVVLIVAARLERFDRSIIDAARDLGAGPFRAFTDVVLPLVAPAIVGAALIAIAWSFDEFIVTFFTIGGGSTLPIMIWGKLRRGIDPSVNAIASVILAATILSSVLLGRLLTGRELAR
jgi:ABC-type spermidine/putrescine transport system permease subunit II